MQTIRYNGYPAIAISGDAAPGYSTGEAMDEMERLAAPAAGRLRLRVDRPVARRKACPARRPPILLRLLAAGGVPVPGGAVRELVDPARGDAGGAAGRARRAARRDLARHAERRVLQGRA